MKQKAGRYELQIRLGSKLTCQIRQVAAASRPIRAAIPAVGRASSRPIQALQVDGRFLTKKLTDLTTDEIRALEARVEMIEPDQGMLALTDRTESTKCEPELSREEGHLRMRN